MFGTLTHKNYKYTFKSHMFERQSIVSDDKKRILQNICKRKYIQKPTHAQTFKPYDYDMRMYKVDEVKLSNNQQK